jgi:hypothetical protein
LKGIAYYYLFDYSKIYCLPSDSTSNISEVILDTIDLNWTQYYGRSSQNYEDGRPAPFPLGYHYRIFPQIVDDTLTNQWQSITYYRSMYSHQQFASLSEVRFVLNIEKGVINYCSISYGGYQEHSYSGKEWGSGESNYFAEFIFKDIPFELKDSTLTFSILSSDFNKYFNSYDYSSFRRSSYRNDYTPVDYSENETRSFLKEKGFILISDTLLKIFIHP